MKIDVKELFYEADTRKHQQWVAERLIACSKKLLDKAVLHDASKFSDIERSSYIDPVWKLNTTDVEYGSEQYKEITKQMGEGWKHHCANNDHHPEFFETFAGQTNNDPIQAMDLFALMEMLCDWIGAAKRKGNAPSLAFKHFFDKYHVDEQLQAVLKNTLPMIEKL